VAAGTAQQVAEALAAAEPYKAALVDRGVLVVPLPIFEDGASVSRGELPPPAPEDIR
jgi:hypothetical protein